MALKDIGDAAATSSAFGAYFNFLPEIAALFAIIWTAIRMYEWFRYRILKKPKEVEFE